ncbi:Gfo/Idh/MocA family oxidoreductase [Chloroflexi bacterium TSY]|nr:Gfo/Idh/MocA family oxidoreductase [Chloroflexi bacterium TSY]
MTRKLKLALVGLGRRGRGGHLPVYAALSDTYDFVAVCDKDEAVLSEVAAEHGANAYTSVRDLVEHEELDVADVVVPGDAHHAVCCFLADAGVNIIV